MQDETQSSVTLSPISQAIAKYVIGNGKLISSTDLQNNYELERRLLDGGILRVVCHDVNKRGAPTLDSGLSVTLGHDQNNPVGIWTSENGLSGKFGLLRIIAINKTYVNTISEPSRNDVQALYEVLMRFVYNTIV